MAVSGVAPSDGDASRRGLSDQPQARAATDAADGDRGARSEAEYQQTRARPQDLPLSVAGTCDRAGEPGLAADITYSPIGRGFLYLVAIIDWASRAVLSWRLSNTMDVSFCIAALQEALAKYGAPKIFNTDQGSQFTSTAFTGVLVAAGIAISMDGREHRMDNEALGYQAPMAVWRTPWLRRRLWT